MTEYSSSVENPVFSMACLDGKFDGRWTVDLPRIKYIVDMQSDVSYFLEAKKVDHAW